MTTSKRGRLAAIIALGLVAGGGCSGGGQTQADAGGNGGRLAGTGGATTGAGGATETGAGGSTGAGGASCAPRATYGGGETSLGGLSATAAIVDETGAAVSGVLIFLCGLDICEAPARTGADGRVTIRTNLTMKRPAFKYGDGVTYALLGVPLTAATTDFSAGNHLLATGKLTGKPGAALTAGAVATSGDVSIAVPAGGAVGINTLVYDSSDSQLFRAVALPLANLGPVVGSAGTPTDFALAYGVAPAETILCPAAAVTVTLPHRTAAPNNDLGWAPGTAVEFWVTTTDVGQIYAPYAGWAKMSEGAVSADGASAVTSAGPAGGFVFLENFAIRKAP